MMNTNSTPSPSPGAPKKPRTAPSASPPTPPPLAAASLAVLTEPALLRLVSQFQHGVPVLIHELVTAYDASGMKLPMSGMEDVDITIIDSAFHDVGKYWASAMRLGDLAAVQLLCRMRQWPDLQHIIGMKMRDLPKYAAVCGRVDVLQWLHANNDAMPWRWDGDAIVIQAVAYNHDAVASWLLAARPDSCRGDISRALSIAAGRGSLQLLRELIAFRPDALTAAVMDAALRHAQWEVIHYLHEHSPAGCSTEGMNLAAWEGHLDVVQFLHETRSEGCTTSAMDSAALCGHLHVVKFLHEHRTEGCTSKAFTRAARAGHVEVVKFLHEQRGMDPPDRIMGKVLRYGNLHSVLSLQASTAKSIHETRGIQVPERLTDKVLKEGKLAVVRYLHEVMNLPIRPESLETVKEFQHEALTEYVASRVHPHAAGK